MISKRYSAATFPALAIASWVDGLSGPAARSRSLRLRNEAWLYKCVVRRLGVSTWCCYADPTGCDRGPPRRDDEV
jgi:hypothetical protein